MKLSDYLVTYLAETLGIRHVFTITGGHCAHIIDSIGKRKRSHGDIEYICVQHEQAGAMAVEVYSRVSRAGLGAMVVTSGPGATNMLTGVCCAWFDSIPALYIAGQVNTFESKGDKDVRQIGFQETDTVSIYKSVTKYAVRVDDPAKIRYELEKAVYLARSGRPGPVLLDIPMDVQRADINPETLQAYTLEAVPYVLGKDELEGKVRESIALIKQAKRPVVLLGGGIKLGNATKEARKIIDLLGIPFVVSWSGLDIIAHNHPLFVGQIGVYGNRGANFAVQNADLLLSLGSRIDTRQAGGKAETFAREAKKIVVEIDHGELHKDRGVTPDVAVCADVKDFLNIFAQALPQLKHPDISEWLERAKVWRHKYPACLPEYFNEVGAVNAYVFIKTLSEVLGEGEVVVPDCGGNLTWTVQAFDVKEGQRIISAMGNSPMGYSLAASMGACIGRGKKPTICIIGDGGMQVNIQELQTIVAYKLPIKIFLLNSRNYAIMMQFEEENFGSRYEASNPEYGYTVPDFVKVASAYGIETETIRDHKDAMKEKIRKVLASPNAVLCDVNIKEGQRLIPKTQFGQPIEDLSPPLPREEFLQNMLIKPYQAPEQL